MLSNYRGCQRGETGRGKPGPGVHMARNRNAPDAEMREIDEERVR